MRNKKILAGVVAVAFLALAACSSQKGPASQAVAAAEAAFAGIREEASKYLPSDLQGVEASVAALQAQLASKDYKSVIANAPALMTSINSLTDATSARKTAVDAATAEWAAISTDVPKMASAIQTRLETLAKSKRIPKNLSATSYDSAKAGYDNLKATWDAANAAAAAGDPIDAVAKGKEVQAKGNEVLALLGMAG
ncbi:MAG: hypothetical protein RL030_1188 [Pseudomonadota bacterium]|jgi:hypothetical protein